MTALNKQSGVVWLYEPKRHGPALRVIFNYLIFGVRPIVTFPMNMLREIPKNRQAGPSRYY